jgi:hypothetical protein
VRRVLVAWVSKTDLRAPTEREQVGVGPIAQALEARAFDKAFLLSDYDEKTVHAYMKWLRGRTMARIEIVEEKLSGPTQFGEIHEAAVRAVALEILLYHLQQGATRRSGRLADGETWLNAAIREHDQFPFGGILVRSTQVSHSHVVLAERLGEEEFPAWSPPAPLC